MVAPFANADGSSLLLLLFSHFGAVLARKDLAGRDAYAGVSTYVRGILAGDTNIFGGKLCPRRNQLSLTFNPRPHNSATTTSPSPWRPPPLLPSAMPAAFHLVIHPSRSFNARAAMERIITMPPARESTTRRTRLSVAELRRPYRRRHMLLLISLPNKSYPPLLWQLLPQYHRIMRLRRQ